MTAAPLLPQSPPPWLAFWAGVAVLFAVLYGTTVLSMAYVQKRAIERANEAWYNMSPFAGMAVGGVVAMLAHPAIIAAGWFPPDSSIGGAFLWVGVSACHFWAKSFDSYALGREHYETFGDDWTTYYPDAVEVAE